MARVKLIQTRDDVSPEDHALFDELAARRGRISGPSSVVLHSPRLARPWNAISEFLHGESIVEAAHAELAVCATARALDCAYIWAAHEPQARANAVSEAALAAVASGGEPESLADAERSVIEFVRQITGDRRVQDGVFTTLLEAHGPRWMVELTAWVGRYSALAGILNCFEVQPAPDAAVLTPATLPAGANARTPITRPASTPRILPITSADQMDEAGRPIFDAVAEGRGSVRGPFSLLLYSPSLCRAILDLSAYLREDAHNPAGTRELAVIATAREQDCPYVWAAHAPAARKEGVPASSVEAVRDRATLDALPPAERDIVALARALLRDHRVEQALFDRLVAAHGIPGLVELTAVIGHYVFVTTLLNAFEFAPGPDAEPLPL